jgi:hypothetical protein
LLILDDGIKLTHLNYFWENSSHKAWNPNPLAGSSFYADCGQLQQQNSLAGARGGGPWKLAAIPQIKLLDISKYYA